MKEKKLEWAKPVLKSLGSASTTSGDPGNCQTGYNAEGFCITGSIANGQCGAGGDVHSQNA